MQDFELHCKMAESANIAEAESHLSSNWFLMSEIQINLLSHQLRHLSLNVLLNCFLLPLDSAVGLCNFVLLWCVTSGGSYCGVSSEQLGQLNSCTVCICEASRQCA